METFISLLGPLHPPLVHFAVVCPILAFFALLAQWFLKKPWLPYCVASLGVFTFLSAVAAAVTGHLFSLHLGMVPQWALIPPEEAAKGQLRDHALWGTASFLFSLLILAGAIRIFQEKPWPFRIQLILGFVAATLFGMTGREGGEMVYGSKNTPFSFKEAGNGGADLFGKTKDYRQNLVQMNSRMWNSRTHGHRWVNTYVSKEGVEAYKNGNPMPEGSLVVKESFQDSGGKASDIPGPLYVMFKGKASDSPDTHGWQYAFRWEKPVEGNPEELQSPVTWLPGDDHLVSCVKCHNHFKASDYLGGVPEGFEKK